MICCSYTIAKDSAWIAYCCLSITAITSGPVLFFCYNPTDCTGTQLFVPVFPRHGA